MKKKINFCGFWKNFDPENNYFTNLLRKYYTIEINEDPDYLFCSVFSNKYVYNEKAIRIFFTGECQTPDFNLVDYALGFDRIQMEDRYCRLPLYLLYGEKLLREAVERGGMRNSPYYRDKFCSFVYSNPYADPVRRIFFQRLDARMHVDSGGRYMNNIGTSVDDKVEFEKNYRFSIAFENYAYPGYMTEKVMQAFAAGTIPIYWGDPRADQMLDPNSYINISRYNSIDDAIDVIIDINNDNDRYLSMVSHSILYAGRDNVIWDQQNEATDFIRKIFEKNKEEAFRRNRGMRGREHEEFFKRYVRIDEWIKTIKGVLQG